MAEAFVEGMIDLLRGIDVPDEEIEKAEREGPGHLLALYAERALIPGRERLTRLEVAERAGIDVEQAAALWRALGFADVPDDQPIFTEADVEALDRLAQVIESGIVNPDLALQITRVMGRAVAQIAAAQIDLVREAIDPNPDEPPPAVFASAPVLLDDVGRWLAYFLRRHLAAEAKRAALQATATEPGTAVVGFADLVGFTGISQALDEQSLASAVSKFEGTSVELVGRHEGRTVKMIGDEVMFEAPTSAAGARIALDLVDAFASDDELPDVRVGLAFGPAIRSQGDLFGTAPNLASRLVEAAYPSTVLISDSIHEALEDEPGFSFREVRPQNLKGFGRTRFWVLRREGDEAPRRILRIPIPVPAALKP
jgi:adenylate cyclase